MRFGRRRVRVLFGIGAAILLVTSALLGSAITVGATSTPTTFTACLTPGGTLHRVVQSPAVPKTCSGDETQVSWNETGPAGPPGVIGSLDSLGGLPCDANTPDAGSTQISYQIGPASGANVSLTCVPSASHQLVVSGTGTGSGTVLSSPTGISCGSTCTATYGAGTSVTLAAVPGAGSVFSGWGGACTGTGSCHLSMQTDQAVTATFTMEEMLTVSLAVTSTSGVYAVTSSPSGIFCGSIVVSCSALFPINTTVTLTEEAFAETFNGWGGDCLSAGTSTTCSVTMDAPHNVVANFGS